MPSGFTRTATGFRAWVRVTSKACKFDAPITKRFPKTATPAEIRTWRKQTRDVLRQKLEAHKQALAAILGASGTFRADAATYLLAVKALTTYKERVRTINLWVDIFGDRRRDTIKAHEIRAVRDAWLTVGPRRVWKKVNNVGQWVDVEGPLSASTVNNRLRALSNMWTVLDGRRAPNPARDDVPEVNEPVEIPRAIDYDVIRKILDAMSDQGRAPRGEKRLKYSLAKTRARVMAWTGVTPKELGKLVAADIHWDDAFLLVPARRKGRGAPGRIVPLGPEGLAALTEFDRLNAYGTFRQRVVLRAWHLACRTVVGRHYRVYDLRHSFITSVVRATGHLGTAQILAGHVDKRTTGRYAMSALLPMLRDGIAAFTTSVAPKEEKPS